MLISLSFISDIPLYNEEKPYTLFMPAPEGFKSSNCIFTVYNNIPAADVRGIEKKFDLETFGFRFVQHSSQVPLSSSDFRSPEKENSVVQPYLAETIQLVKDLEKAEKILCFDWRVRQSSPQEDRTKDAENLSSSRFQFLPTAQIAHSDYSHNGGHARLRRQLSKNELNYYSLDKWRIRIIKFNRSLPIIRTLLTGGAISVWRPLVAKVYDAPLVLCDKRSIQRDELLEEDKIHEDHWEEGLYVKYRPSQQWYWLSEQTCEEVAIFVTWDSDERDMPEACPPHASFYNSGAPKDAPPRESVEVRLMVFTKR